MFLLDILVGAAAGLLSGFGIGGGTILILWLTLFGDMNQLQAGGINLLYFPFSATPAILSHNKSGLIDKKAMLLCVCGGLPFCIASSMLVSQLNVAMLRKGFGVLLIIIGIKELFSKDKQKA